MTYEEAMKLAEEVFDEEYSGLDKDSFLIGFQEAYNALTTLYKDNFELVKRMREAQIECSVVDMMVRTKKKEDISDELMAQFAAVTCNVVFYEDKVDEYLKKME